MAREVNRGEIWMYTFGAPDKRRPVIVISRQILLDVLQTAIIVPITTTLHGSPTEVELGVEDGLKTVSCANLANIQTVSQRNLTRYVGAARPEKIIELCRAQGVPTFTKDFSLTDVYAADEAFVTGTFGGLTPVTEVDGRPIGDGRPGELTRRLRDWYLAEVERSILP
jgi:mRNA-degrading endonuclease toxin of MazEF toxin-antitoxin module